MIKNRPAQPMEKTNWKPKPEPWHQKKDEPPVAYRAFCFYLDRGPAREAQYQQRRGRSDHDQKVREWRKKFKWKSRAKAYDEHMKEASLATRENIVGHAKQLLLTQSTELVEALLELSLSPEEAGRTANHQLAAIRYALDLAGVQPTTQKITVEHDHTHSVSLEDRRKRLQALALDQTASSALRVLDAAFNEAPIDVEAEIIEDVGEERGGILDSIINS